MINKHYEWRKINDDGSLAYTDELGPYFDRDRTLRDGAWNTEAEAVAALEACATKYTIYGSNRLLVLLTVYEAPCEI